jgi:hypothetical protein
VNDFTQAAVSIDTASANVNSENGTSKDTNPFELMQMARELTAAILLTMIGLSSCGGPPVTTTDGYLPLGCATIAPPDRGADTVAVAMFDIAVPEFAPWGHNSGENMIFHLLYETLIMIDCNGDACPRLAASWKREDRGRRWVFTLRRDAAWWDGTPVIASDIIASWEDALRLHTAVDSAAATGDNTVTVYLNGRTKAVPRAMAAPAFAVSKRVENTRWHVGSGRFKLDDSQYDVTSITPPVIALVPSAGPPRPMIQFVRSDPGGARDLLDREIDLMVTSDPAVIDYAAGDPRFESTGLPWDRTYLLLSTTRARDIANGRRPGDIDAEVLESLARDAIRGEARGVHRPAWWDDIDDCAELPAAIEEIIPPGSGPTGHANARRILYNIGDPVAKSLAERIVALAAAGPGSSSDAVSIARAIPGIAETGGNAAAEGVTPGQLNLSLRVADDFAYVITIPRRTPIPCYEAKELVDRAPWLASLGAGFFDALIPLVDTRSHVIARTGQCGVYADWYNNLVIVNEPPKE